MNEELRQLRIENKLLREEKKQALQDNEQCRLQMAGISTAAIGYWKEGDGIHSDYDTPALRDVAKLYAKYDRLYKRQNVIHGVIAGALFDFMGWLTSRPKRIMLGSSDEASPAVDAIQEFAKMRGLSLDDARVQDWQDITTSPAAQPAPVQDVDWKDMYEKEKRRSEMWVAKYEKDIGPLEYAVPLAAQPKQEKCRVCGEGEATLMVIRECNKCGSEYAGKAEFDLAKAQPEQKKPQNCGTGYCSCIECVMKPEPRIIQSYPEKDNLQPAQFCRTDGRCQYAIDSGAEGMGHCPPGKCCMPAPVQEPIGYFTVNDYDNWEQIDGTSGKPLYERPATQPAYRAVKTYHEGKPWYVAQQEPVAKVNDEGFIVETGLLLSPDTLLYTTPPAAQRTWVGLTDEQIWLEYQRFWPFHLAEEPTLANDITEFARAIEAKLKELNHDM